MKPKLMRQEWNTFLCAVQFLTRIPIRADIDYNEARLNQAVGFYPLVGVLIGLLVFSAFFLSAKILPYSIAVILSLIFSLLLTGAFHEDGFADMCDGIGGGQTPERSLEIMRDSRLGTYGVSGLVTMLGLKVALLISVAEAATSSWVLCLIFLLSHALSRTSAVMVIATSQYVRLAGAAKPVATGLDTHTLTLAIGSSAVLLIGLMLSTSLWFTLYLLAFLAAGHIGARKIFEKKLGGYTGDCLGAVQQVSEVSFLLGACIWLYSY